MCNLAFYRSFFAAFSTLFLTLHLYFQLHFDPLHVWGRSVKRRGITHKCLNIKLSFFIERQGGKNHIHINNALFWVVTEHSARGEKSKRDILERFQFVLVLARLSHHGDYFHTSAAAQEAPVRVMIPNKFKQNRSEVQYDEWCPNMQLGIHKQRLFLFLTSPDVLFFHLNQYTFRAGMVSVCKTTWNRKMPSLILDSYGLFPVYYQGRV